MCGKEIKEKIIKNYLLFDRHFEVYLIIFDWEKSKRVKQFLVKVPVIENIARLKIRFL